MGRQRWIALAAQAAAVLGTYALCAPAQAQQSPPMRVWRCGNVYTNSAVEAEAKGCVPLEGGNIRVVPGTDPSATRSGESALFIQRSPNGHFFTEASINGLPVRCIVDTGSSSVAVSDAMAREAGLQVTRKVTTQTAGGTRIVYAGRARVQVGSLAVPYADVTAGLPPTVGACLLGQSFLRNFDLSMSGDTMVLKPHH